MLETPVGSRSSAGQGLGERMGGRQLRVAVGADDQQTVGRGVGHHVAQKLEARLVGPVQVVEHEDDRTLAAGRLEKTHHGGIEEVALGVGVGGLRAAAAPPGAVAARAPCGPAPRHGRPRAFGAGSSSA